MGIRRIVSDLAGRSHHRSLDLLVAQVDVTVEGVELAARMTAGELTPASARADMVDIEHAGDDRRAALIAEMSSALTTPIDREDLYRLSRSVDDVLDNVRDLVRETDLYRAEPDPDDTEALVAVAEGLGTLRRALRDLIDRPSDAVPSILETRKKASRVRQLYQAGLARLFSNDVFSVELLKRRELLRRLDVIGLRLGECADALSDAMQKRSH